jgi:aminoglycoside 6'-N-acetyltransferase I
MSSFVADPDRFVQFVAYLRARLPAGFVEASLRSDYVNGTETSPVAFLEGIYVAPEHRHQGIAAQLVSAVAEGATSRGC